MALESTQSQTTKQQQTLTAGQLERIEILAMSTMELETFLREEEMSNPVMELDLPAGPEGISSTETGAGGDGYQDYTCGDGYQDYSGGDGYQDYSGGDSYQDYSGGDGYQDYSGGSGYQGYSEQEEDKKFEIPDIHQQTVHEYLISQIPVSQISRKEAVDLAALIGYVDEKTGYLIKDYEDLLDEFGGNKEYFNKILTMLRNMEPAGVGTWDLRDLLLLQLERKGSKNEVLKLLIKDHLQELERGHISGVAAQMHISAYKLKGALEEIRTLNPRPLQNFNAERTAYIIPDIIADYTAEGWRITLQHAGKKICGMNAQYVKMEQNTGDPEVKKYLGEKIRRVEALQQELEDRERMLTTMMQQILITQEPFARGNGPKRKLLQKDIAEQLGVHPSTINRAAKNKYVKVPAGVFQLKEFFQSSEQTEKAWTEKAEHRKYTAEADRPSIPEKTPEVRPQTKLAEGKAPEIKQPAPETGQPAAKTAEITKTGQPAVKMAEMAKTGQPAVKMAEMAKTGQPAVKMAEMAKTEQPDAEWTSRPDDKLSKRKAGDPTMSKYNWEKERITEICLLAPTDALMRQMDRVCALYDKKIDAVRCSLDQVPEKVRELNEKGVKVYISRRGIKKAIEAQGAPVVGIGMSLNDYVEPLKAAQKSGGKVGFFTYGPAFEDVQAMCYMLGIDALFYSYHSEDECYSQVRTALMDGVTLGIGGADSAAAAEKMGLAHIIVENSSQSLLQAVETAEQLLVMQREEHKKQEQLKIRLERLNAIFNFTHDAIIAINEKGEIEVINQPAEKILGIGSKSPVGQPLQRVLPTTRMMHVLQNGQNELNQLMNINGTMVYTNRIPIVVDGHVKGAVATFQDVVTLQKSEQKIRTKLHEKGLVAKYHFKDIIGHSDSMKKLVQMAEKFAASNATILIRGESGTGKELMAQSIHNASFRADGPFVAVNCGALPKDILEAELFGYTEGAFTGASKGGKMGLFEMAHGGTIFLDEIGEMPLETQVKLLRVLQEKEIRRVGSDRVTPVDIRVITATNRSLKREIRERRFREDLYYRLNVLSIEIPPLRNREDDIEEIALSVYRQFAGIDEEGEKDLCTLLAQLKGYSWPGNVRELHNMVERVYVLHSQQMGMDFISEYIRSYRMPESASFPAEYETLPDAYSVMPANHSANAGDCISVPENHVSASGNYEPASGNQAAVPGGYGSASEDHGSASEGYVSAPKESDRVRTYTTPEHREKTRILEALDANNYEMTVTAEKLGISRSTLWRKIKKYNIEV